MVAQPPRMNAVVTRAADPRLRSLLAREYVGFSEPGGHGRWRMPPSATVTMIVNVGDGFGGLPRAFVAGMEDAPAVVERGGGEITCLDLKLDPLGAYVVPTRPGQPVRR
jgi:hypothetical protein